MDVAAWKLPEASHRARHCADPGYVRHNRPLPEEDSSQIPLTSSGLEGVNPSSDEGVFTREI